MHEIIQKIKNINRKYRPIPFWSWNDKLTSDLLKWQIQEMVQAGIGGYFMHARGGLETEYLSAEWMECVDICIKEGRKNHLDSWIYDEVGWGTSGFGTGKA